jgi:hypothetical protein
MTYGRESYAGWVHVLHGNDVDSVKGYYQRVVAAQRSTRMRVCTSGSFDTRREYRPDIQYDGGEGRFRVSKVRQPSSSCLLKTELGDERSDERGKNRALWCAASRTSVWVTLLNDWLFASSFYWRKDRVSRNVKFGSIPHTS